MESKISDNMDETYFLCKKCVNLCVKIFFCLSSKSRIKSNNEIQDVCGEMERNEHKRNTLAN
jgi:hypothetical protein